MNYEYSYPYPYPYPYPYKQKSNHHSIIKFVVFGILLTGLIIGGIIFAIKTKTKKSTSGNKSYCLTQATRESGYTCDETSDKDKCISNYTQKNWFDGKDAKSNCVAYCKSTFKTSCKES